MSKLISVPGLPESLRAFVDAAPWTFARTMPEWPHEYIVRRDVDDDLFMALVRHIRSNGVSQKFYRTKRKYLQDRGLLYWTMGEPLKETTIINRCRIEDSYEIRAQNGTLPPLPGNR